MEKIKHVFFDLDNTLWDHRGNSEKVLEQMFINQKIQEKHQIQFHEWHHVFYIENEKLWIQLRKNEISKEKLREMRFQLPFLYFGIDQPDLAIYFEQHYLEQMAEQSGLVSGAVELIDYLRPKYRIHVITNGFVEVSGSKIRNSPLNGKIETLTCADDIGVRKPAPEIFDLALSRADAHKEESLLIGDDWIADAQGAMQYGMQVIFFDSLKDNPSTTDFPIVKNLLDIKELL